MANFISRLWHRNYACIRLLAVVVAIMMIVHIVNHLSGGALDAWGVIPRQISGLPEILLAPWLHGSWSHLFSNLSVLLVLLWLGSLNSITRVYVASIFIIVVSGALVWGVGRSGIHIGASGWIFGLWGWLLANACFQRRLYDILIAAVVILFYGGLWYGLFPRYRISFEGHLAGLIAGVACSWLTFRLPRKT